MNMKKTVAGVMASAMAVSAMAAMVSADQDQIALTYDLKTYVDKENNGTVTVTSQYTASNDTKQYIVEAAQVYTAADKGNEGKGLKFTADESIIKLGGNKIKSAEIVVTSKAKATGDQGHDQTITNSIKYTRDNSIVEKNGDYFYVDDNSGKVDTNNNGMIDAEDHVVFNGATVIIPLSTAVNKHVRMLNATAFQDGDNFVFTSAVAKVTYEIPAKITKNTYNNWDFTANNLNFLGIDTTGKVTPTLVDINNDLVCKDEAFKAAAGDVLFVKPEKYSATAMVAGTVEEAVYPFKTVLNPKYSTRYDVDGKPTTVGYNDVVAALKSRKSGGNYYTNPIAVINDAIANNEEVTFTFKTFDGYVTTQDSKLYLYWLDEGRAYGWQTSKYDWYNPTFSQHLYTNEYNTYSPFGSNAYDMYGSYSSAWGTNLFTGAVVINSGLTMQLNQTDKFFWGNDTLSFDWFTLTDEGKITNAKQFLTSMLLYTPVDWYWDSLTVTVGNTEEDSVDAGEGLEADGDELIDDEEIDEIIDDIVDEIVEDPIEETVEEVVEEAPVEAAPSPATGNAPVALAVIPVALAAAAVVAKKRG